MANGWGNPGAKLTRNNRLAAMLMQQEAAAPPITAHTQGLASLARNFMAGQATRADTRQQQAAQQAMMNAVSMPSGQAPGVATGARAPRSLQDRLMAAASSDPSNPYLSQMGMPLAMQGAQREQQLSDQAMQRAADRADYMFKQENKAFRPPAPTKPPQRRILKGADGRNYYADDGTPVLPGVSTPQEKFLELLEPPQPEAPAEKISMPMEGQAPPQASGVGRPGRFGGFSGAIPQSDAPRPINAVQTVSGGMPGVQLTGGGQGAASKQPSVRDIFNSLPQEAQTGIKMASDPMKAFSSYLLKSKGMDIQFNADGTIESISQGGSGAGMQKSTRGQIEKDILSGQKSVDSANYIEAL